MARSAMQVAAIVSPLRLLAPGITSTSAKRWKPLNEDRPDRVMGTVADGTLTPVFPRDTR